MEGALPRIGEVWVVPQFGHLEHFHDAGPEGEQRAGEADVAVGTGEVAHGITALAMVAMTPGLILGILPEAQAGGLVGDAQEHPPVGEVDEVPAPAPAGGSDGGEGGDRREAAGDELGLVTRVAERRAVRLAFAVHVAGEGKEGQLAGAPAGLGAARPKGSDREDGEAGIRCLQAGEVEVEGGPAPGRCAFQEQVEFGQEGEEGAAPGAVGEVERE